MSNVGNEKAMCISLFAFQSNAGPARAAWLDDGRVVHTEVDGITAPDETLLPGAGVVKVSNETVGEVGSLSQALLAYAKAPSNDDDLHWKI